MDEPSLAQMQKDIDNLKNVALVFNKTLASQNERIAALESGSIKSSSESGAGSTYSDPSLSAHLDDFKVAREQSIASASQIATPQSSGFSEWIAVDWPMKVGSFLLLLGMGWFVSYAFMNNWIGPVGRISLGILFGVFVLLFGQWRFKKSLSQGNVMLVLGATIIFLTIFAARSIYDFFTPASAVAIMFLVVAYLASLSVVYRNTTLSMMSLLAGSIVPLLAAGESSFIGLFSYLLMLFLGMFIVVWKMKQESLILASLIVLGIYSMPYFLGELAFEPLTAFLFALVFAASFFVASFLQVLQDNKIEKSNFVISALNSVILLWWINAAVETEWKSFICLSVAFVLSIVAYAIARMRQDLQSFAYVRFASAALFLVAATVFEFSGPALTIAFIVEIGLLSALSLFLLEDHTSAKIINFLFIIPGLRSFENVISYAMSHRVFTEDFFVIALFIATLSIATWMLYAYKKDDEAVHSSKRGFCEGLFIIAFAYTLLFVWMILHIAIASSMMATFIALTLYTILGMIFYVHGKSSHKSRFSYFGNILFAVVLARLFLVEIWQMSLGGRVVTFFIIGALLISTAFMGNKDKDTLSLKE